MGEESKYPVAPFPGDIDWQDPIPSGTNGLGDILHRVPVDREVLVQGGRVIRAAEDINRELGKVLGMTDEMTEAQLKEARRTIEHRVTLPEMIEAENAMLRKVKFPKIRAVDSITGVEKDMSFTCWRRTIQACALLHKGRRTPSVSAVIEFDPTLKEYENHIVQLFSEPNFHEALRIRGVDAPFMGLSERQMQALIVLTSVTDRRSLGSKLRSLGVKDWEFEQWLGNPRFKDQYRQFSEQLFDEHQGTVNIELTKLATNGDLPSIKYFNELSGRWNPETKAVMNIRQFMQDVVDIITTTVKDPETLRLLGMKLSTLAAGSGAYNNPNDTPAING